MSNCVSVLGGGLAGCEAALALANSGIKVMLYEQKPINFSPAHSNPYLAELVCSNSFKAMRLESAAGLLKHEMRLMGSQLLPVAQRCAVPAGGALAVDRNCFATEVTMLIKKHPLITLVQQQISEIPRQGLVIVATGPLTAGKLAQDIASLAGQNQLSFYDAAAPIVTAKSLNKNKIFAAARYNRGEADYLNCPFDKAGYEAFHTALVNAETANLHAFDSQGENKNKVYEGCMPVEVMAGRGAETLRYGPLRPVGLLNPATGNRPWACVQLRQENAQKTLYNLVGFQTNLKFAHQRQVFGMIPGLENAEFVRYGVMHRNTFLNSPEVLLPNAALANAPNIFFAGQITGFEGYMESAASGLLVANAVLAKLQNKSYTPPPQNTMCGALAAYIRAKNKNFQPMGANMGLLPPLENRFKDKKQRYEQLAKIAIEELENWLKMF